jgi:hypothetical protein
MRKTVIANTKPLIRCKQVKPTDVHRPDLEELLKTLFDSSYSWADIHHDDYYVYKVSCEGQNGIGVSSAFGEMVITDLKHKDADGFWMDDSNVKFTSMSYKDSLRMANRKAKELGIKKPRKRI